MTTLHITEYANTAIINGQVSQIAQEPAVAEQTVTFTSSSVQSNLFNKNTRIVRLVSSGDCHIAFGTNPTASSSNQKMELETVEWRGVTGETHRVAAIDA